MIMREMFPGEPSVHERREAFINLILQHGYSLDRNPPRRPVRKDDEPFWFDRSEQLVEHILQHGYSQGV